MIAEFILLIFFVTAASDNERIAATSLLHSALWNDALINFSRGQWSLYVSESRAPLADTACWLILHAYAMEQLKSVLIKLTFY